jgi:hypothetical protein
VLSYRPLEMLYFTFATPSPFVWFEELDFLDLW